MQLNSLSLNLLALEDVIDRYPLIVGPDTSVVDAIALLSQARGISCTYPSLNSLPNRSHQRQKQADCILVVEGSQLIGLFTERDVVRLTASEIDLSKTAIVEVMTRPAITLTLFNFQDVSTALSLLRQYQIRHLPIVDELGIVVGIVTPESIRQVLPPTNLLTGRCVAEVMTSHVIHAPLRASLLDLARLMADHQVSCIVIAEALAEDSISPRGIITERDIVQFRDLELDLAQTPAQAVMSTPLFCLSPANSLWFAHQEMERYHVRRLVVAGEQGELLGIITQTSLLQVFNSMEISNVTEALQQKIEERMIESGQLEVRPQHENVECQHKKEAQRQTHQDLDTGRIEKSAAASLFDAFLQQEIRLSEASRKSRKQAEDYIKFQANVLSQVNDAVIAIDSERRITYCNRKAEQLFNRTTDELLNRTLEEACQYRWLKVEDEQAAFDSLAATGLWQGENIFLKESGEEIYVESSLSVLKNDSGTAIGLLAVIRDITERKRAEQKIREQAALLDVTTDAILVRALDNQILFWNNGAEYLYGWKAQEVLAKNANELLYKETSPQLEQALLTVIDIGLWQGELSQITKAGKEITVSSRWALVRDEQGNPKSILTVSTDITEKKQLEAQFLRAQRLESIGTLASGIAHDLNNVLAPILMTAQLLQMKISSERNQQLLTTIESNAKRGASLVKQVLSFARGFEGKRTIVQVKHLISEIQHVVRETFPKSIEISTNLPSSLWTVSGDATHLHQVLMNLVVNARDAMPNGGNLMLSAENLFIDEHYARMNLEATVGPYIAIAVSDTGTGMSSEVLERIFEPFFTTKEVGKGTGLGLSTVIGIIKSHGGFVNVYSEVSKGTEFKVYLPAVEETGTQPPPDCELPIGQGEVVLVVDDEAAISEIIKTTLETYNYKTFTASDGVEAIALYAQHKKVIQVVLVNLMMPSMDGLTTIRTLQKMNLQAKMIVMSGLASTEAVDKAYSIGIEAFLLKPFTAKELLHTLNQVLST